MSDGDDVLIAARFSIGYFLFIHVEFTWFEDLLQSFRYNPSNISVIEWLGAYYIDSQFCEKAIQYFERASIIQPNQVKWQLMIASCHRRSGNYQQALDTYKTIHRKFPDNVECLRFLVRLCTDLGLKEVQEYSTKLKKAEKAHKIREERAASGTRRGSGRRRADREGSAGSETDSRQSSAHRRPPVPKKTINFDEREEESPYQLSNKQEVDSNYVDPLGPQAERPKTAARRRGEQQDDEFGDEELGDDLLPE